MRAKSKGKFLTIILVGIILVSTILFLVFKSDLVGDNKNKVTDATDYYGVGEPLMSRSAWVGENLNVSKAFEIMENLSVHRLREWVWRQMVFNESGTSLRQNSVEALNNISEKAQSQNITVMGMVQDFPSWMTNIKSDEFFQQIIPSRNLTEGSPYKKFLNRYEKSWETLAKTFPNITMWEIGNEYNLHIFLHPQGYNSEDSNTWFSQQEAVNITTDLLYYGSQGIHAGNPKAVTVMCGLARGGNGIYDIRDFLESIYENIESGEWPSTNSTDFFQVACWHPYLNTQKPTFSNWVEPNIAVHNVMVNHGDGEKPVVFSEFGYSDNCTELNETQIAKYLNATFHLAWENFQPWLKTIYWFRLIDPIFDANLSARERAICGYGFGLTKSPAENYTWKPAADAYKKIISIHTPPPVQIYQGDLVLTGNNVTVIEGIFYINGSIIVEENATLNVQNAFLKFTQTESYQYNMTLRKPLNGNPRLLVYNSMITSNFPVPMKLFGNSTATINDSTITISVVADGFSDLSTSNSTISFLESHDSAEARVDNSDINVLTFGPNSVEATILNLKSELVTYWNFITNCSVNILPGGYATNITLTNTSVNSWDPVFYGSSNASIINSVMCHPSIFGSSHVYAVDSIFTQYMYLRDASFFSLVNSTYSGPPSIQDQSKVQVSWYLDVHVVDSAGQDVPSANVTATYLNATVVESKLTDAQGWARLTLMEKTMNATDAYPVGNYTVEATYESCSNNTTVNMTENKQITLTLEDFIIPEYPSFLILPLFIIATLLAVIVFDKKRCGRELIPDEIFQLLLVCLSVACSIRFLPKLNH